MMAETKKIDVKRSSLRSPKDADNDDEEVCTCTPQARIYGEGGGVRAPLFSSKMTCGFLIQFVFCQKKKNWWFIGSEVKHETRLENLR